MFIVKLLPQLLRHSINFVTEPSVTFSFTIIKCILAASNATTKFISYPGLVGSVGGGGGATSRTVK
jgi:hypothetical protein